MNSQDSVSVDTDLAQVHEPDLKWTGHRSQRLILDGEIVALDEMGQANFQELQNAWVNRTIRARVMRFMTPSFLLQRRRWVKQHPSKT